MRFNLAYVLPSLIVTQVHSHMADCHDAVPSFCAASEVQSRTSTARSSCFDLTSVLRSRSRGCCHWWKHCLRPHHDRVSADASFVPIFLILGSCRYASGYFVAILAIFYATMKKVRLVHWALWIYDQLPGLHGRKWTRGYDAKLTEVVRILRRQPVCVLLKTDEVRL